MIYDALDRYVITEDGRHAIRKESQTPDGYTTYICVAGDTIENIAARYLGNPRRYWEISDINPQIKFPTDLAVGTVIRLPAGR